MKRWPVPEAQSALVLLVPEAEDLVSGFRAIHDPSAAAGVPAHVTVLYPFIAPEKIDAGTMANLRRIFAAHRAFDLTLASVKCFPTTVYLAPEPRDLIRALTKSVWENYPDYPPYEGKHADPVPHLTVGTGLASAECGDLAERLTRAADGVLPISKTAAEVALLDNLDGAWRIAERIPLGAS